MMRSLYIILVPVVVSARFNAFSMRPSGNNPIIPLDFTAMGREVALVGSDVEATPVTAYIGEESCYVSVHGQRSAGCIYNEHDIGELYSEESARHHPGADHVYV
mmetsp:Transcript_16112/g.19620  ORF Transcript_16112/g.19620 Transcript_16112/m.19620 type:complete len:104 (+) Transcript_16112:100-411(+)